MNRNTIIGLVLIFGIFIAYSFFMSPSDEEKALKKTEIRFRSPRDGRAEGFHH